MVDYFAHALIPSEAHGMLQAAQAGVMSVP